MDGHVTRKIQIRHKGILSVKISEHWHCQVNLPMSVVFRDWRGTNCSELTQPEAILCEGTRAELMDSPGASFASCFNVAEKKPQQLRETHRETPCVFQLSRQRCHPCHALPKHNCSRGTHQNLVYNSVEDPGSTISPPSPGRAALGCPTAARGTGTRPRGDRWGVRGTQSPV